MMKFWKLRIDFLKRLFVPIVFVVVFVRPFWSLAGGQRMLGQAEPGFDSDK